MAEIRRTTVPTGPGGPIPDDVLGQARASGTGATPLGGVTDPDLGADQGLGTDQDSSTGQVRPEDQGGTTELGLAPAKLAGARGGFFGRLSTGTGAFNILGPCRVYYAVSAGLVLASILLILFRGFTFGIDFAGGTRMDFQPPAGQDVSTTRVAEIVNGAIGLEPDSVQTVGSRIQISTSALSVDQVTAAKNALVAAFNPDGGVSDSAVSETWGGEISQRALVAVIVFLIAVAAFLWIRYEKRVALGAVISTLHDLVVTAGIYALVGFEVTPATVIGLLTILGFSLYDTVVVYDKVQENTKGLTSLNRRTYPEAANLAINQTLMRSINTSLIALLPVAGLLVAGVAILGSGTLKDLALVQLVGMIVGAYSSVFVAVPIAVDLKLRDPSIKAHTARVLAKRRNEGLIVDADGDPIGRTAGSAPRPKAAVAAPVLGAGLTASAAPRPGSRPMRPGSTGGTGGTARRPSTGSRPTGKRQR